MSYARPTLTWEAAGALDASAEAPVVVVSSLPPHAAAAMSKAPLAVAAASLLTRLRSKVVTPLPFPARLTLVARTQERTATLHGR
ncbi:hypothetical protein Mro03_04440 [Microbispora rosea subsp. rosea]|nr:hypothetical protein Mro03_04440 [Microbispora rosea subsp. rosea]